MKRCFINIKLLIYIILLQQWKALESLPTSSSSDKSPAPSNPSGGQSSTPRSQNQTSSSSTQSQLRTSTNNSTRTNSSVNQQNQPPKSPSQSQSQPQSSSSINSVTTPTGTRSDQSQVTKITVDIDKKSSTNELEYSKNDEIHKYAPKSGHVITKVTNGSAVIWESDDNVYSLRVALNDVSSNPEEHFLSVLDNKGRLFLFQKSSDKSWKDVTEDRYCLFKLKFLTDNDEEIANDKYSLCIYCFTYSCAFDKGSKCSKIKYEDKIIWNTNDHTGFAPIKEVYLYMIPIKAFVRGNNDQYKKLELKKSAQPNETVDTVAKVTDASDTKSSPAPVATQSTPTRPTTRLTNVIVDIDKKQNSNEFDYSSDENYHTYTRKTGHSCSKVMQGTSLIWESQDNVCGTLVRFKEQKLLVILLDNNTFKLFQHLSGKWTDITKDRYDVTKLKLLGEGDSVLNSSNYKINIVDLSFCYSLNQGIKCAAVKLGDDVVWKTGDDPKFQQIKTFFLGLASNNFYVKNMSDEIKKIDFKPTPATTPEAKPATLETQVTTSTQPKSAQITATVASLVTTQPDSTQDKTPDTKNVIIPEAKPLESKDPAKQEEPRTKATTITEDKSAAVATTAAVSATSIQPTATPVTTAATPAVSTPKAAFSDTSVTLDIDKTETTDQFDYSNSDDCHTYTPKSGHSFSKVTDKNSPIWESKANVFGTLVRIKVSKGVKYLVVLLHNNKFSLFEQSADGKWKDITVNRHDTTKLKFYGDNDNEITTSDYSINIIFLSYEFIFNDGVMCLKVTLGDDVVWSHTDDPKFQLIKSFSLGLSSNSFFVKNESGEFKKVEPKPVTEEGNVHVSGSSAPTSNQTESTHEPAKPEPEKVEVPEFNPRGFKLLSLNSSKKLVKLEESKYKASKDRDEYIYDLDKDAKCHEIRYENKTIWKFESGSDKYPLYITYRIDQHKFVVTFEDYFVNCTFENGEWKRKGHSLRQGSALPVTKEMTAVKSAVLDLNDLQNTKMYDIVQTGNVRTFTPKEAGFFSGVIRTTGQDKAVWTVIWQIQGDFELANKISYEDFGKGKQILILDTRSGIKMLYKANQNAYWKEVAEQPQNAFETIGAVTTQEEKVDMFEVDILKPKSTKDCDCSEFDTEEQPKEEEKKQIENARKAWKKKDDVNQQRRPPTFKYQNYAAKPKKGISNIIDSDTIEKGEDDDDPGFDGSIWRQANLTQYATHACFRYTPKRCLAVLLSSGNFLLYEEKADEELDDITSKSRGEFFKLAFYTKEQETNTYRKLKIEEITRSLLNLSYIFTFDNIECHRITHDNKTIWRHGVDSNFGTLKSVYFHLLDYKVSVENTSGKKEDLDIKKAKDSKLDDSDPILQALKQTTGGSKEQKASTTEPTPVIEDESETDIPEADLTSLNINDTSSSSKYQCSDNGIYKTFTAIHGHGFNKVTIPKTFGSDTIWESSGSDYAIKVRLKENSTGEKYMVLLLVSKKFKFFYSSGKNKPLADNTAGKKSFNDIKLFYKNETKCIYEELNPRLYTAALYHLSLGYKPKERVKFHLIKFGDKYVYSYDDNQAFGHMKGVYVDLVKNNLYVVNTDDQTKEIDIEKGVLTQPTITPVKTKPEPPRVTTQPEKAKKTPVTPPETTPSEPETSPVPEAKASPVTAPSTTLITLNIDNTQSTSEFDYSKDENYHTYTPKDDHVFSKVTEKNAVIWEWKDTIYAKFARIRPKENEKYLAILLTNNSFKLFHQSHGKTWTDITKDKHDMTKLRFYGEGDAVLKSTHYTVSIVDLSFNYAFNEGVNCRKINYDDNVVWNHSDDKKFEFIKSFSLGLVSNKFFVKNNSGELKKIEYESEEVIEPEVTKEVSAPVTVEAKEPEPTEAEEPAKEASEPAKTTPIATAEPVLKPKPATNPATLDIEKTQSTADFEYSKNSNYHTYTPKSGHSFTKVTEKENVIWECKDGIPGTLVRKKKDEFFVILLQNNDFVLFQKTKKQPWTDITSQRHNVTALKFYGENDTELSTSDYLVTVFDFTYRVTFKDQNSCKKIKYGDDEIWKYKDNACKHFELGLVSNKFFVCNNERSQNNLNFKGPIIPRVPKTTPVEVTAATTVTQPKTSPPTITPTPATTDTTAPTPTTTSDTTSAQPKVTPPTPAPATTATTPEPAKPLPVDKSIVLDIETTTGTSQFEFSEAYYIKTFNGKDDCVFDKVSEGPTVVWESEGVSGTMVRTKLFSNNDRFLVILLKNDTFMVFQKPSGGVWSEITGSRCDVKKLKFYGENDKEITAKDYKITLSDLSFSHMFKEGVKCEMVKMGEEVVWSHTDDKKFEDIMSFSLGLVSNKFFVKNRNGELKKLEPKPVVEPVLTKAESDKVTTTGPKPVVKSVKEEVKPAVRLTGQVTSAFHSKLKLYASDPVDSGKTVPLEFEVLEYPNPDSLLYLLGDRCVQLIFDGKVVWECTSGPYPTSLYFKSSAESSLLYLNFDPYYYVYIYDGNDWVLKEELSHRSSVELDPSMYPENITIVTEKTEGESVTLVQNDTNMYKVYDHGGIFLYLFSDGVKCVEIKYCDHTVHDAKSVGQYPNRFIFESKSLTFEFDFENKSTSYRLSDSEFSTSDDSKKLEKIEYEVPGWIRKQSNYKFGSKLSLSDLSILTSDNRDGSDAKRIDVKKSMLSSKKWLSGFFYPVTKPYLELRYKHNVFKSTEYPYRGNPKILLFNIDDNNISVFFDSKFKVSFNYLDLSDEETVYKAKRKPTDPDPDSSGETESDSDSNSDSESNSESEGETVPVAEMVVTPPKTTVTTPESQPQTVYSPTPKVSTSGPKLSQPKSSSVSTGFESNTESKPISKQAKTKAPVITIHSEPTDLKSSTNVTVDIQKKHNTNEFNYYRNDNFKTYVPKSGYGFSKVTEGSSVIWESRDNVFATFVTTKRKKFLVILLQSGDILLFHKNNAEQPWEDITDKRYDLKKLKFLVKMILRLLHPITLLP